MLLLDQTLSSLEKQQVLAQATQVEMISIYNEPQYLWNLDMKRAYLTQS
jgi:hypothetical protein